MKKTTSQKISSETLNIKTKATKFSCTVKSEKKKTKNRTGLSLRAGGRGFSPTTKRVAPGYFYWKIEQK